jgi:glycerophosphoryl diester phosphodiesterase
LALEEPLAATLNANGYTKKSDPVFVQSFEIVPRDAQAHLLPPTTMVRDAHRAGLVVHPYTFGRENDFLPVDFRQGNSARPLYLAAPGDFPAELRLFLSLGVDGLFTDNSDVAVAVRSTL